MPFAELPTDLKRRAKELDLALWFRDKAYPVFRQREGGYEEHGPDDHGILRAMRPGIRPREEDLAEGH